MLTCPVNDQTACVLFTGDAIAVCHRLNQFIRRKYFQKYTVSDIATPGRQVIFQNNLLKIAETSFLLLQRLDNNWTTIVRIAARLCAPQPKFLYFINRMML